MSRVLSGAKTQIPISDETQERVRRAADELGYRASCGTLRQTANGLAQIGAHAAS